MGKAKNLTDETKLATECLHTFDWFSLSVFTKDWMNGNNNERVHANTAWGCNTAINQSIRQVHQLDLLFGGSVSCSTLSALLFGVCVCVL